MSNEPGDTLVSMCGCGKKGGHDHRDFLVKLALFGLHVRTGGWEIRLSAQNLVYSEEII